MWDKNGEAVREVKLKSKGEMNIKILKGRESLGGQGRAKG